MHSHPHPKARLVLMLALASSAGAHAALIPAHGAGAPAVIVLFGLSAIALGALAMLVDRSARQWPIAAAALLLASLLVLYVASRLVVVWPLTHAEPVDAIGAATKLLEAVGLWFALGLMQVPQREGVRP